MTKVMKFAGIIIGIVVLIAVLAMIGLVTLVNPNHFKPLITAQVAKYTGRQLTIDGDLSWTFFPYLGVKAGHMVLSNPPGFQGAFFAEISQATVEIKVLPLFSSHIESRAIKLDGVKIVLIKDAAGKVNWNFQKQGDSLNTENVKASNNTIEKKPVTVTISAIDVTNASVFFKNEQNKKVFNIEKFSLQASHIGMLKPFPVTLSYDFAGQNPNISGHNETQGEVSLNWEQKVFSFRKVQIVEKIQHGDKKFNLKITGNVIADLTQHTLQWTDFHGEAGNLVLDGKVLVSALQTAPSVTGHLQLQPFDLKAWLKTIGQDVASIQVLNNATGNVDFTYASSALDLTGNIKLDEVQANHLTLTNVKVPLHFQNNRLSFSPITANFYQGTLQSNASVNFTNPTPQITATGKVSGVQMASLLQDLGNGRQKIKLGSGTGSLDFNMTMAGSGSDAIVKSLNGTANFNINNGAIQGLDIGYLINRAASLLQKHTGSVTNSDQTQFSKLTASAVIRNGVISNNDLLLNAMLFTAKGSGTINLVAQTIDYSIEAQLNQAVAGGTSLLANLSDKVSPLSLAGITIPIHLTGSLKDPSVRVDPSALAKAVVKQQIENKVGGGILPAIPAASGFLKNILGH